MIFAEGFMKLRYELRGPGVIAPAGLIVKVLEISGEAGSRKYKVEVFYKTRLSFIVENVEEHGLELIPLLRE